jgi:hypothetical protein
VDESAFYAWLKNKEPTKKFSPAAAARKTGLTSPEKHETGFRILEVLRIGIYCDPKDEGEKHEQARLVLK